MDNNLKLCNMKILVTGGAGFIGSHLVDRLMLIGSRVRIIDNLSTGNLTNIEPWLDDSRLEFIQGDLKDKSVAGKVMGDIDLVFHLASNPEVRTDVADPITHFNENLMVTFNVLEAMRENNVKLIVFTSTSTVYGEPNVLPTPEDYGPLEPISTYGASKLGCEALISSFCHTFALRGLILRLANIVGDRARHGVIVDFIKKLQRNPSQLEILGDGNQEKAYLHIDDCVDVVILTSNRFIGGGVSFEVYNIGSSDQINVKQIAEIVAEEMGLENVKFELTGGVDGGRGWKGDVKKMSLSIEKLSKLGWEPKLNSERAIRRASQEILTMKHGVTDN